MLEAFEPRAFRGLLPKLLRVIGFVVACYLAFLLAAMACMATVSGYYDDIEPGEPLSVVLERSPGLDPREIGVMSAVYAMPPSWLPERTGTVGGIAGARGVALEFLHPAFTITLILDDRDRVLIKYPSYE